MEEEECPEFNEVMPHDDFNFGQPKEVPSQPTNTQMFDEEMMKVFHKEN